MIQKTKAVWTYPDGREVCQDTASGRKEYKRRLGEMCVRQMQMCCMVGHYTACPGSLIGYRPTFDHEDGRGSGGGKRDDRIVKDGRYFNGAAHLGCNVWKGSRKIDYNNGILEDGGIPF